MFRNKLCLLLLACCVVAILLVNSQTVNSSRPNCSDSKPKDSSNFGRNTLQHALEEETLLAEDDMDHMNTLSAVTLKGGRGGGGRGGRGGRGGGRGGRGGRGRSGGRGSRGGKGSRGGGKGSRGSRGSRGGSGRGRGSRGGRGRSGRGGSRGSRSGSSRSSGRGSRSSRGRSGKGFGSSSASKSSKASSRKSSTKATNRSPTDLGRVSVTARRNTKTKNTTNQQISTESKETQNRAKIGSEGLHMPFTIDALNIMFKAKKNFDGVLGPHTQKLPPIQFISNKETSCVACRVDCLKRWNGLNRQSIFAKCKKQYYYYGCEKIAPCLRTRGNGSTPEEVEGMLGICYDRNGCELDREVATRYVKLVGLENATRRIAADIMSQDQDTK